MLDISKDNTATNTKGTTGSKEERLFAIDEFSLDIEQKEKPYRNLYGNTATNLFTQIGRKDAQISLVELLDMNTQTTTVRDDITYTFTYKGELNDPSGQSSKLLRYATVALTQMNSKDNIDKPNTEVEFSLWEYAKLCGYKVYTDDYFNEDDETNAEIIKEYKEARTEEAKEQVKAKAKRRANKQRDKARRDVGKGLAVLFSASGKWKRPAYDSTNKNDYIEARVVVEQGIYNSVVYIKFTDRLVRNLIDTNTQSQYSLQLLKIDGRNKNAFRLGDHMLRYYTNRKNIISGNYNRLTAGNLLSYTDLPDDERAKAQGGYWTVHSKEALENNLDQLIEKGILTEWEYIDSNMLLIPDDEISNSANPNYRFRSYSNWENTLIHFEITDSKIAISQALEGYNNKEKVIKKLIEAAQEFKRQKQERDEQEVKNLK